MGTFQLSVSFKKDNKVTGVTTETSVYNIEFDTKGKLSTGHLVGTACNELYKWVDLVKDMGSSFSTTGGYFDIYIKSNSTVLDTSVVKRELKQKLAFNKTDESRKRFAQRVHRLAKFMASSPSVVHIDDVVEALS
jgi:hypothetical protein